MVVAIIGGALAARELRSSNAAQARAQPRTILPLINARRAKLHLAPLTTDRVLASLARIHVQDMRREGFYAHDNPQGMTFEERLAWLHRSVIGEVLAYGSGGFGTAQGIVSLWMASPPHRRVLLDPRMRRIGVGVVTGEFLRQGSVSLSVADLST